MLDNDSRLSYQRPEIIGAQARISLEVVQKGFSIGVIIRILRSDDTNKRRQYLTGDKGTK